MTRFIFPSLLAFFVAGCKSSPPPPAAQCNAPFTPDAQLSPEAQLIVEQPSDGGVARVDVSEGDRIALLPPPQGGFVIYTGLRVRNLDPCGVTVRGEFRDPNTLHPVGAFDERGNVDLVDMGDGWFAPALDFARLANVTLCANVSDTAVVDTTLVLDVKITDREGRVAEVTRHVTPYCPDGPCAAECNCLCAPLYTTDRCNDAGVSENGGATCVR